MPPNKQGFVAGHYVRIRIPCIRAREWHSFSVTGLEAKQGHLVLLIQCHGDWTRQLLRLCEDKALFDVDIQGSFPTPSAQLQNNQHWLLIAGGVGITPFLSLLQAVQVGKYSPNSISILWVVRDACLLRWLHPWISSWAVRHHVHWHLYVTGQKNIATFNDIEQADYIHVHYGRPDWTQALNNIATQNTFSPSCVVCGSANLVKQARYKCQQKGWLVWSEQF